MTNSPPKKTTYLTVADAAMASGVTKQAVHVAIHSGALSSFKMGNRRYIKPAHLEEYRKNRYSRAHTMHNGALLFGEFWLSVNHTLHVLGVPRQRVYYLQRSGKLVGEQVRATWRFHAREVRRYICETLGLEECYRQEASARLDALLDSRIGCSSTKVVDLATARLHTECSVSGPCPAFGHPHPEDPVDDSTRARFAKSRAPEHGE